MQSIRAGVLLVFIASSSWGAGSPVPLPMPRPVKVEVLNFPAVQQVELVNPACGGSCARFQLVGFTAATLIGNAGVLGLTRTCEAEFPGSRLCSTEEVMNSIRIPENLVGPAWVRPIFEAIGNTVTEISGRQVANDDATCAGWLRGDVQQQGFIVTGEGRFTTGTCDVARSVACCAPVQ